MKVSEARYYRALHDVAKAVNSSLSVQDVLHSLVKNTAKAMNAAGCSLMLLTPSKEQLVHSASYGLSDWYLRKGVIDSHKSLAETLEGKSVAIVDAPQDPRIQYRGLAEKAGIASMLSVPLVSKGEVIGAVRIYTHEQREFTPDDLSFLETIADLGAISLENARLYESLQKDYDAAKKDLAEAKQELERLSIGLVRPVKFAHPSEEEFARLLDFYRIEWLYEPRSFPLQWEGDRVTEMFTPDFYLPALDLYLELTTMKQSLVTEKNRKVRRLKELYPDISVRLLYRRDYNRLLAKYGYGPLGEAKGKGIGKVLFSNAQIQKRVRALGKQISADYAGQSPILIGVLRGVVCFMADLIRHMSVPIALDFMAISYYGADISGAVRITKDLDRDISGRHVLMVEDIVDTGMTLNYILDYLSTRNPASLRVCALLDKRVRRLVDVPLAYVGFEIPDEFVVGYGLDYQERYRNLPFIAIYQPE